MSLYDEARARDRPDFIYWPYRVDDDPGDVDTFTSTGSANWSGIPWTEFFQPRWWYRFKYHAQYVVLIDYTDDEVCDDPQCTKCNRPNVIEGVDISVSDALTIQQYQIEVARFDPFDRATFARLVKRGRELTGEPLYETARSFRTTPETILSWEHGHSAPAPEVRRTIVEHPLLFEVLNTNHTVG
jgi:hypothetical protein